MDSPCQICGIKQKAGCQGRKKMSLNSINVKRRTVLAGLGIGLGATLLPGKLWAQGKQRVALLMVGSISDGGWNQLAFEGLADLKAKGFDTAYVENVTQARIPEVVRGYADDGFDLIIGHGYNFGSTIAEFAPEYPDQKFFVTAFQAGVKPVDNVQFIHLAYVGAAYAAGALAALISDNRKAVGFVGGGDNPTQQAMNRAFISGAQNTVEGLRGLGVVTGDYNNAAKGKEAALTMIGNGADVIWHAADVTGLGVIQGAAGAGAKVIGCYANQTALAPDRMATSFMLNLRWVVNELGRSLAAGSFAGGTEWRPSIKEIWVQVYGTAEQMTNFNPALVNADAKAKFEAILDDLESGKINLDGFE